MAELIEGCRYELKGDFPDIVSHVVASWDAESGYWCLRPVQPVGALRSFVVLGKHLFAVPEEMPLGTAPNILWGTGCIIDNLIPVEEADHLDPDMRDIVLTILGG